MMGSGVQSERGSRRGRAPRWCAAAASTALVIALSVTAVQPAAAQEPDTAAAEPVACGEAWTDYDRPVEFPGQVKLADQVITTTDGVDLLADVYLPADAAGVRAPGEVPVVLTITGYNKNAGVFAPNPVLVPRGYAHVIVDDRGTGNSGGSWDSWGERSKQDYTDVLDWIAAQPWSGPIGTIGPSYMGITSLFAAARQHPDVAAVFAVVPMGDAYRDIVFAGGQINASFIPLWLGIVTATSLLPGTDYATDPVGGLQRLLGRLAGVAEFTGLSVGDAVLGGTNAYDGPFWRERSPLEFVDQIDVPTFIIGGLDDLFQRGEPMLYEALRANGTDARLVIGPWAHLTPFIGLGAGDTSGVPDFDHLALRWFDEHLMGLEEADAECMPQVTQWMRGPEEWQAQPDWPHPDLRAARLFLDGDSLATAAPPEAGERTMLPVPVNGLCSRSANQWLAGALGGTPCAEDEALTEALELTYTSEPFVDDVVINGPIQADIWLDSTVSDSAITVRVQLVDEAGTSRGLTNGYLLASLRAVDESRSRFLDGLSIQPWHPFTEASQQPLRPGEPVLVPVEVFPTSAVIPAGSRLRVSIGPVDAPHNLPTAPTLVDLVGAVTTIHHGGAVASSITLPVVGSLPATAVPDTPPAVRADLGDHSGIGAAPASGVVGGTSTLPSTGGADLPLLAVLAVLTAAVLRRRVSSPGVEPGGGGSGRRSSAGSG